MMTREEIAAIDRDCEQQHISQQEYLDSHGIARHQYYRWKRRYREEDEQSLVPAGFVPMMPGAATSQPFSAHTINFDALLIALNKKNGELQVKIALISLILSNFERIYACSYVI